MLNLAWLLVFLGGAGWGLSQSRHFETGLAVLLLALLVHILPYFALVGAAARLGPAPDRARARNLALQLKAARLLPAILIVLGLLAGPVLGFLQAGGRVPGWTHGIWMALVFLAHLRVWSRNLVALDLVNELLELEAETG